VNFALISSLASFYSFRNYPLSLLTGSYRIALCRRDRNVSLIDYCILMINCFVLVGCTSVRLTDQREIGSVPSITPKVIYVDDFTLQSENMSVETGVLPVSPVNSASFDESDTLLPRLLGVPVERGVRARELVNLMASSLVEDLKNLGFDAYRLKSLSPKRYSLTPKEGYSQTGSLPGDKPPAQGWLVSGTFVRVDEGDRLRRALIGFGDGATELEAIVSLSDLSGGNPRLFCELSTSARSDHHPGALISLDPYEAVGRFIAGGLDLDKNVMKSAARVATAVAHRAKQHECSEASVSAFRVLR
jgi:hypothetical protein